MGTAAFAAQTITDRTEIDKDDLAAITTGEMFGYTIESIGDLDGDGIIDLATTSFEYQDSYTIDGDGDNNKKYGQVTILFMNNDGSVKGTNIIKMDTVANGGIGTACLDDPTRGGVGNDILGRDERSLEELVFVGDLDSDGEPTIAVSMTNFDAQGHDAENGAIFMIELNSDGTVDNCKRITEGEGNFAPDTTYFRTGTDKSMFGWGLIATDLNGDGKNELVVSANNNADNASNFWTLFLNNDGSVASHIAIPLRMIDDLGVTAFIDAAVSIDGAKKIAIGVSNKVHIVNLNADGSYSSSTSFTAASIDAAIEGNASFGKGLTNLDDINGDGINDILVGAIFAHDNDNTADTGAGYVIYLNSDDSVKDSQEITNDSEFTRTGAKFLAADDYFGNGMTLWKTSSNTATFAIGAHNDDTGGTNNGAIHLFTISTPSSATTTTSGGGSDDDHNSRPTFGKDYKTFRQLVDEGLVINDKVFTVTDNYYTPMPMQNMTVGVTQNFTSTVFAPHTLFIMEFGFGIPDKGDWYKREASIEIETDFDGEAIDFKINEYTDAPLINATSLDYAVSKVKCNADDNTEPCYRVSIEFSFLESPIGKVLGLQAIDKDRKNQILYFNDGITVLGDSQNPPMVQQTISEIKYKGLQTIQRIDKENDIWMSMDKSEPVLLYQQNDHGTFIPLEYRIFEKTADKITTNIDRLHSEFGIKIEYEQQRAILTFDARLIDGVEVPSWTYVYPLETQRADDVVLQQAIKDEAARANITLIELLELTHYGNIIENGSSVGILKQFDNRDIADILSEERATKKIEATERAYLKQVLSTQN